ncbi:MAG: hypothetical protein ABL917_00850 [Parcubacteria group bacterium]
MTKEVVVEIKKLHELALVGARIRLEELKKEQDELEGFIRKIVGGNPASTSTRAKTAPGKKKRKPMSPKQKRDIAARMKKYWADKRKAKAVADKK